MLYALKRPGEPVAIMVLNAAVDPKEEAEKGGPVEDVFAITEQEAEMIRQARPKPVAPVQEAPPGYVSKEEFEALKAQFASMAADIKTAVGV